jgi:very-short-patch-repair endonuclease
MNNPTNAPAWRVTPETRERARHLRRQSTEAEKIVWDMLRAHRLEGVPFRRQTPIGPYFVDFVAHRSHLVIEIDGGQHFAEEHQARDARRDAFLRSEGYRVLRFINLEVMTNREGVWTTIAGAVAQAPSLTLPRKRGRGQADASGELQP